MARSHPRPSYVGALSALVLSPMAKMKPAAMAVRSVRAATILHAVMLIGESFVEL